MLKTTPQVNQAGEQSARMHTLRSLFDTEEGPLLRYVFSLTGRRAVAEEIVQEAFLQLHSHPEVIAEPKGWLFRVARNRAFTYLRKNKREILTGDKGEAPAADSAEATPDAMMQRMERIGAIRQILKELGETDRELVKLKYFENLKYREISERTGLTIGNVGYRLHHILKDLGEKLRPLGVDE